MIIQFCFVCIILSICEQRFIRYTPKTFMQYGKMAKPRNKFPFFKELYDNYGENQVFLKEVGLAYDFILNAFKSSWK